MTNQHPNGNGRLTEKDLSGARGCQTTPLLAHETRRASGFRAPPLRRPEAVVSRASHRASRVDWQVVALWVFVAVSFAAFVFAGLLIWAKCKGSLNF